MNDSVSQARRHLLTALRSALEACRGDRLVRRALEAQSPAAPVALVAAGKAAPAMARGAAEVLGESVTRALVIGTRAQDGPRWPFPCRVLAGDHPVPGNRSLAAGRALTAFLEQAGAAGETLLVCLSGGASSLVEVPPDGITPADLRRANEWLLGSGLPIAQVNAVRQRLSRIKGGRLARLLGGRRALVLALSDVPGNDPALIGSGWLAPPLPAPDRSGIPAWLDGLLERAQGGPGADEAALAQVESRIVGDNGTALAAAEASLHRESAPVHRHQGRLEGDVVTAGERIAASLAGGEPGFHLWGGECTVRLAGGSGRGGRCQHLGLSVARQLAGRGDWCLLAAGTDGRDGNSDAAGALVDGGTVARGADAGMDADRALAAFDSGSFLEASGDLVDTGDTGTNVNDLVIGFRLGAGGG